MYYKIIRHPARPRQYNVFWISPSMEGPLPNGTIRTQIGWVEKLNDVPLTKNEAKALVEEHKERTNA